MAIVLTRKNWWWWPLVLALIPVARYVEMLRRVTGRSEPDLTPDEAARYLRDFINHTGGEWDWDDFTSVPLKDPVLEAIRYEAEMVQLPTTDEGLAKLHELLTRAEALTRP